jgi:hypothetical protein
MTGERFETLNLLDLSTPRQHLPPPFYLSAGIGGVTLRSRAGNRFLGWAQAVVAGFIRPERSSGTSPPGIA